MTVETDIVAGTAAGCGDLENGGRQDDAALLRELNRKIKRLKRNINDICHLVDKGGVEIVFSDDKCAVTVYKKTRQTLK